MARSLFLQAVASVFGLIVLGLLHTAAWIWLSGRYGSLRAALCVASGDAILAAILLMLARRRFDPAAHEALAVRRRAIVGARASLPLKRWFLKDRSRL